MKLPATALCLDVSLVATGCAVWRPDVQRFIYSDCIKTKPTPKKKRSIYMVEDNLRRYYEIAERVRKLIRRYNCFIVFAELPTGGAQSMKPAVAMAASTAVVATTCFLCGVMLHPIQPLESKRLVSDKGAVTKEDIQKYVRKKFPESAKLLPDDSTKEHIADAMALIAVAQRRFSSQMLWMTQQ